MFDNKIWGSLNFLMHIYFLILYLINLYIAKDLKSYLSSYENIFEFFSLIPYFIFKIYVGNVMLE
jgi:intracellular septation protein A